MTLPGIVAVDVLLEPDGRMLAAAEANNARLLRQRQLEVAA